MVCVSGPPCHRKLLINLAQPRAHTPVLRMSGGFLALALRRCLAALPPGVRGSASWRPLRTFNTLAKGFHQIDDIGGPLGGLGVFDGLARRLALHELAQLDLEFVLESRRV